MGVTLQAWLAALQAMLPPGRAFTREPDANLTKLLSAIAAMFLAAQLKLEALLDEADPRRATSMLPDWERTLGLPDHCTPADQSTFERQSAAYQRLVEQGGQSASYFTGLAALLGQPGCTVTELRPMNCNDDCNDALNSPEDRFNWRLNIPAPSIGARPMNCNDDCSDPLDFYTPSLIECPIKERKPAHTNVFFVYTA